MVHRRPQCALSCTHTTGNHTAVAIAQYFRVASLDSSESMSYQLFLRWALASDDVLSDGPTSALTLLGAPLPLRAHHHHHTHHQHDGQGEEPGVDASRGGRWRARARQRRGTPAIVATGVVGEHKAEPGRGQASSATSATPDFTPAAVTPESIAKAGLHFVPGDTPSDRASMLFRTFPHTDDGGVAHADVEKGLVSLCVAGGVTCERQWGVWGVLHLCCATAQSVPPTAAPHSSRLGRVVFAGLNVP